MTVSTLLDVNLLIALVHEAHVHHAAAQRWMSLRRRERWASCAATQLGFLRLAAMAQIGGPDASPARALQLLETMAADPRHDYWPDAPPPLDLQTIRSAALVGHRQFTDAWLLGLAVARGGVVATLDRGLQSFAAANGLQQHAEWIGPEAVHEPPARYRAQRRSAKRG